MWCRTCSEECKDHPTICTVCGDTLVARPTVAAAGGASSSARSISAGPGAAAVSRSSMSPEEAETVLTMMEAHRTASGDGAATSIGSVAGAMGVDGQRTLLEAVQAASAGRAGVSGGGGAAGGGGEWQATPPEALDPQAGGSAQPSSRPTSKECIDRIPRIEVDGRSSILHECTVEVLPPPKGPFGGCGGGGGNVMKRKVHRFDAIIAEFGPAPPYKKTGRLVLTNPATGKGGLGPATMASLGANANYPTIAYLERGGDVTFARKALMAQQAGACAVVIGNNVGVWPYVMRDSTNEAAAAAAGGPSVGKSEDGETSMAGLKRKSDDDDDGDDNGGEAGTSSSGRTVGGGGENDGGGGLTIPVVMVKRSDGNQIRSILERRPGCTTRCTVSADRVEGAGGDCVVCTDAFKVGDTVMRLPFCSHCFHERCALSWLETHNTCPYCRRELPTDDEEYEAERRRQSRTHASAHGGVGGAGGLHESQWETLFG